MSGPAASNDALRAGVQVDAVFDAANDGEFDDDAYYGSIADLLAQLGRNDDPASLFDKERELPEWLYGGAEHELWTVHAATAAAHPHLDFSFNTAHGKVYWVKVSSATGLLGALDGSSDEFKRELRGGVPVYVFVMPTTSLNDANRIYDMATGREKLPVEGAAVHICILVGFENKLCAYNAASKLLEDINKAAAAVENNRICLVVAAEAKLKHLHDMKAEYEKEKAGYLAVRTQPRSLHTEMVEEVHKLRMRMFTSCLLVAREVAKGMQDSVATMRSLGDSLANKAADLGQAMSRLTFIGCASPAPLGLGGVVGRSDGN